jgi:hypothetical protein
MRPREGRPKVPNFVPGGTELARQVMRTHHEAVIERRMGGEDNLHGKFSQLFLLPGIIIYCR